MARLLEPSPALQRPAGEDRRLARVRARAAEFRRSYVDPVAADLDRRLLLEPDHHPDEVVRRGCEFGLLSLPIPAFFGGRGGLALESAVALEEICAGCAGIGTIFGAHYLGITALLASLDVGLLERVLGEIARAERKGEPLLCAAAITEPTAGTDVQDPELLPVAQLSAYARKVEGGYVLDGRKVFVANGGVARYAMVALALDPSRPLETMTTFVVERGTRGFSVGRVERKMGQRACHAAELVFDGCFVPDDRRVGAEGGAARGVEVVLASSRAAAAAAATGIARGAYEIALAHARRRTCGTGLLCDRPWVQQALADMRASIELSRLAYLEAAAAFDERIGRPLLGNAKLLGGVMRVSAPVRRSKAGARLLSSERVKKAAAREALRRLSRLPVAACLATSSLAKVSASDLAVKVCLQAAEILGSAGAEERERVEKCLRDAKLAQIHEGTNQLARWAVYKGLVRGDGT